MTYDTLMQLAALRDNLRQRGLTRAASELDAIIAPLLAAEPIPYDLASRPDTTIRRTSAGDPARLELETLVKTDEEYSARGVIDADAYRAWLAGRDDQR